VVCIANQEGQDALESVSIRDLIAQGEGKPLRRIEGHRRGGRSREHSTRKDQGARAAVAEKFGDFDFFFEGEGTVDESHGDAYQSAEGTSRARGRSSLAPLG
jgi:hypothetical protein